jgi:hypothetical protein
MFAPNRRKRIIPLKLQSRYQALLNHCPNDNRHTHAPLLPPEDQPPSDADLSMGNTQFAMSL